MSKLFFSKQAHGSLLRNFELMFLCSKYIQLET